MYTLSTVRGIGVFAVLAGMLTAGCAGRSSGSAVPTDDLPNKTTQSARFEAFRASTEQQVRQSAPAGYDVSVGSTYVADRAGKVIVFADRNVTMKSATSIGVRFGQHAFVFVRSEVTEFPGSSFQSMPRGRKLSTVHPICNPDDCPDPSPPDPTPPPGVFDGGTSTIYGSTPQADSIAAARQLPCTETFSTNNYPGGVTMTGTNGYPYWTLTFRPGYPYFSGGIDTADVSTAIVLVDGSQLKDAYQKTIPNGSSTAINLSYPGDFRAVRYAEIQVIEHPYPGDNLIMGEASITCPSDTPNIRGIAPPPPPPQPPYVQWWQPIGPA